MRTVIIAEAGVNHNGNLDLAYRMIDEAAKSGADYVKFQSFRASSLVSSNAKQADYQKNNLGKDSSQLEMLLKLELTERDHVNLASYCKQQSIKFLSSAFDLDNLDYLNNLGIDFFKIPSGEITNLPYLEKAGSYGKKVVISTGMSTMREIENAINVLEKAGTNREFITVLHCNTEYPTPMKDVHLRAMITIKDEIGVKVGYSDHTEGIEVPIAAVVLGASIIEKHFTLDKNMEGPDHKASLEPHELKAMINAIRNIEQALGNTIKNRTPSERKNLKIVRKSIHLAKSITKGRIIKKGDLIMKRPGDGISPMKYHTIIGRRAKLDLLPDHKLTWGDLE